MGHWTGSAFGLQATNHWGKTICGSPAVADSMQEELFKARHKCTDTCHVIVIPRLMYPRWRRLFHKVSDATFLVPPDAPFRSANMFEPIWIGIIFPFIQHRLWCLRHTPHKVEMGRTLCEMCAEGDPQAEDTLLKLFLLPRRLVHASSSVEHAVLQMP